MVSCTWGKNWSFMSFYQQKMYNFLPLFILHYSNLIIWKFTMKEMTFFIFLELQFNSLLSVRAKTIAFAGRSFISYTLRQSVCEKIRSNVCLVLCYVYTVNQERKISISLSHICSCYILSGSYRPLLLCLSCFSVAHLMLCDLRWQGRFGWLPWVHLF